MIKYIAGIGAVIIVVGGIIFYLQKSAPAPQPAPAVQQPGAIATSTYSTSTFSIVYPSDFTATEFENAEVSARKPIAGVKFTIPESIATGTTLAADTFLSVEELPRAKRCTGDIYLPENVAPAAFSDNGVSYSLASSSQGAAGNSYEEAVYAVVGSSPCTGVRYFIHSAAAGNGPQGALRPFDRARLLSIFDGIRRSLSLTGTASSSTAQPAH